MDILLEYFIEILVFANVQAGANEDVTQKAGQTKSQTVWWPLFSSYGDETAALLLRRELGQQSFGKGVTIVNIYAYPDEQT